MSKAGNPVAKNLKKADPKDLETQRLAEEQKRLEELKKQEESRKTEFIELPTGLLLVINEYCIQEAWKHPNPKEFFIEFATKYLKDKNLLDNFESIEISLMSEYHLYNLIFCKDTLQLDDKKTAILMNILWALLKNQNIFYQEKVSKEQNAKNFDNYFEKKSFQNDLEEFKILIMNHSIDNPPNQVKYFEINETKEITNYVKTVYFANYKLYRYILCNKQKNQEVKIPVFVDNPLHVAPLSEAIHLGQEKIEIKEDDNDDDMV